MFWSGNDIGGWGYALMAIGMVLFWGAVITGIVLLVRSGSQNPFRRVGTPPPDTAEDVLSGRFARGEIDESEYRSRIGVLADRRVP